MIINTKNINKKGFTLIEMAVSVALMSIVLTAYFQLQNKFLLNSTKIIKKADVKSLHNKFTYLLQKKDICRASLRGRKDGDNILIKFEDGSIFKDFEQLVEATPQAPTISKTISKINIGLNANLKVKLDTVNNNIGYVDIIFKYKDLSRKNKIYEKTESLDILVEFEKNPDTGEYIVQECLLGNLENICSSNAHIISSFNEGTLNAITSHEIGTNIEDRLDGQEYPFNSTDKFTPDLGEYCLSYNICIDGSWRSSALCYDSCRNKFWRDGMVSYEDELTSKDDDFICDKLSFDIINPVFQNL